MNLRLLLAFFVVSIFVVSACETGTDPVGPGQGEERFLSSDVCQSCHVELGKEWAKTKHHDALDDLNANSHAQDFCLPCHTTGLDGDATNSGYDDADANVAARFDGVQCESCHGLGGTHIQTFDPLPSSVDAALCGTCHDSTHHPQFTDWSLSGHAISLSAARDSSAYFAATPACMECHSADYRAAVHNGSLPEDADAFDFEFGITCVVCHDPHSAENEYQLRSEPVDLCGECHTAEGAVPGKTPHHSTADVLQGTGGYEYSGETYESSAHSVLEEGCVACHMHSSPFNATGAGEPKYSGHNFDPRLEACQDCHTDADTFDLFGAQTEVLGLMAELEAELEAATANDKLLLSYDRAKFNLAFIESDGSYGIHNYDYATKLLQDSIDDFEPGS